MTQQESPVREISLCGQWIWSRPSGSPGGETITLRHEFELDVVPPRMVAALTCEQWWRDDTCSFAQDHFNEMKAILDIEEPDYKD